MNRPKRDTTLGCIREKKMIDHFQNQFVICILLLEAAAEKVEGKQRKGKKIRWAAQGFARYRL